MVISILFLPPFLEYLLINCLFFLPVFLLLCWVLLQQDSQVTSHRYWVCWYRFFLFCGTHLQPKMICFHLFFFTNSSILSLSLSLSLLCLPNTSTDIKDLLFVATDSQKLDLSPHRHHYCHHSFSTTLTATPLPPPPGPRYLLHHRGKAAPAASPLSLSTPDVLGSFHD